MLGKHFLPLALLGLFAAYPYRSQDKSAGKDPAPTQTKVMHVEIFEPAVVKVEQLFDQADMVAVVKILSGDAEHYSTVVYKTEVVTPFKGVATGETVFIGPFTGYRIGWEYLAFLRKSEEKMTPSRESSSSGITYGPLPSYYRIMYDGYSIMENGYACVFDGAETKDRCDYGIKINIYQVILPKRFKTFPVPREEGEFSDSKWVRKKPFLDYLDTLRTPR